MLRGAGRHPGQPRADSRIVSQPQIHRFHPESQPPVELEPGSCLHQFFFRVQPSIFWLLSVVELFEYRAKISSFLPAADVEWFGIRNPCGSQYILNRLVDGRRQDSMALIVFGLNLAAASGFIDRLAHRFGDFVCIEKNLAVDVARSPAGGLDQ